MLNYRYYNSDSKSGGHTMKQYIIMIKPASSRCNMRCRYCFYEDVAASREEPIKKMMSDRDVEYMLDNIFGDIMLEDAVTFSFQGGEPTLVGLDWFENFVRQVRRRTSIPVQYTLQTNGSTLDEAWCGFFQREHVLVGLSLDGPMAVHDANRPDINGRGTYNRVIRGKRLLEMHGVPYNVLMVLTNDLARHPLQVWRFLMQQNISYVQFISCMGPLDDRVSRYALTPERFASFYKVLLLKWYESFLEGRYISVKLFDDLVNLLRYGKVTACGMTGQCTAQIVVESDGSVYPCDFYALDEWRLGNLTCQRLTEVLAAPASEAFVCRPRSLPGACADCPYRAVCGGGCPRMERAIFRRGEERCGYRAFLEEAMPVFQELCRQL